MVSAESSDSAEDALERRRLRLGEYLEAVLLRANAEPPNREPSLRHMLYELLQYDLHVGNSSA